MQSFQTGIFSRVLPSTYSGYVNLAAAKHWRFIDRQQRTRSVLCSKPPDLRSVGDVALNPSLRKGKRE